MEGYEAKVLWSVLCSPMPVAASTPKGRRRPGVGVPVLAPVVRQGCVDLGVRTGRGRSSACRAAKTEAPEMSIYLGTR